MSLADYLRQTQVSSSPRYDIGKLKIQNGSGAAVNPRTGQLEQVYAQSPDDPLTGDYTKLQFASDGPLDEGVQSLAGWAPGYYTDKPSTFDNFMERGTLAGLAAIGGAAAGGAGVAGEAGAGAGADVGVYGASGIESAAAPGFTYVGEIVPPGYSYGAGAGAGDVIVPAGSGSNALIGGAGQDVITPATGPDEWADLSSWLGADATGAPAYDATEASLNSALTAGAGGTAAGGGVSAAGGTAAAAAGGGTALSRIMSGNGGAADWLSIAGALAPSALGAYASNQQAKSLSDLADRYTALGGPSRARYEASFAPGFTMASDPGYSDALAQTTKETLHQLSPGGSPVGSGNAWEKTLQDVNAKFAYPALQQYRNQSAATGGYGAFSTAAPGVATGAIGAQRGIYDSIGAAGANIFAPAERLSDLLPAWSEYMRSRPQYVG